ncbi:MAG: UDP-N-acetylmuramoyl-L-alanine--D-glutamate ligase [Patescibacteria group bacterium]
MKISELRDKKIAILGFGVEGQATLRFLKHFFPEKEIGIVDQKDGPDYLEKLKDYDLVVKTAGIPGGKVSQKYTTATNIFFANTKCKVVGVTGTKGKSTTTSLIFEMLKVDGKDVRLVGNIGIPMLNELLIEEPKDRIYVCELSSYQLEDLRLSPHVAVFINFFPDHLDYHGGLENYWSAKKNIISFQTEKDYFVYNSDFEELKKLAKEGRGVAVPFMEKLPFVSEIIPLLGKHNVDNVRAAAAAARILGVNDAVIEKAVREFKPLPHRLEKVGTFKGITFYDDAISTTPESTIAGIEALSHVGTIFLGGTDRGYNFDLLAQKIFEKGIGAVVLFPESGARILKALKKVSTEMGLSVPKIFATDDMKMALVFAYDNTPKGTICLLSTASPSYSLWRNFEEKGELFQNFVKELGQ